MFILSAGHRSVVTDTYEKIEPRQAHRRYVTVDPYEIAGKLRQAGWSASVHLGRRRSYLQPATAIVEATVPPDPCCHGSLPDGYTPHVTCYLDHRGRSSILLQAGALRTACRNHFTAPAFRIHHCSGMAGDFLSRPEYWFDRVAEANRHLAERTESLRGKPGGLNLPLWLTAKAPRLGKRALAEFEAYSQEDGPSLWAGLQALTAVHSRRVDRLVGRTLGDDTAYLDLLHGQVLREAWLS